MTTTTVLAVGGVLLLFVLVGLLALLLGALGTASRTIASLADRLGQLEDRTGRLQIELAGVDDGLGDVAAALREHRTSVDAEGTPEDNGPVTGQRRQERP